MQETDGLCTLNRPRRSGTVQFDRRPASVDRAGRAPNDFAQGGPDGAPEDPGDRPEHGHGSEPGGGRVLVDDVVEGRDQAGGRAELRGAGWRGGWLPHVGATLPG